MRVLQLIDSLRPGGAEKMAVNIANALLPHMEGSYLCCTRQEGMLKDEIKPEVGYLFLDKKSRLDPTAILRLRKYIIENKIDIVHAHSTSFFLAGILRLAGGHFKLIWHDHYGESENLEEREYKVLKKFSRLFVGIISVNTDLKDWSENNLNCKNVTEIRNFIPEPNPDAKTTNRLKGSKDDFKIICVANLRPQKDHMNLLRAFEMLDPILNVSLHLVGENPETEYSESVLNAIKNSHYKERIFYYGSQPEIIPLLKQADVGVLSSRSEGLPLVLIEYGMTGIPVVCTDVGQCAEVIAGNGIIVPARNPERLAEAIIFYIKNPDRVLNDGISLKSLLEESYSEKIIISAYISFYLKNVY